MGESDLANDLIRMFQQMRRHLRQLLAKDSGGLLSVPQIRILGTLKEAPSNVSELAEACGVDVTSMSRMIKTLENRGLIQRQVSPEDRRRFDVRMTAKGRHFHLKVSGLIRRDLQDKLNELSLEQRKALQRSVDLLKQLFE